MVAIRDMDFAKSRLVYQPYFVRLRSWLMSNPTKENWCKNVKKRSAGYDDNQRQLLAHGLVLGWRKSGSITSNLFQDLNLIVQK